MKNQIRISLVYLIEQLSFFSWYSADTSENNCLLELSIEIQSFDNDFIGLRRRHRRILIKDL